MAFLTPHLFSQEPWLSASKTLWPNHFKSSTKPSTPESTSSILLKCNPQTLRLSAQVYANTSTVDLVLPLCKFQKEKPALKSNNEWGLLNYSNYNSEKINLISANLGLKLNWLIDYVDIKLHLFYSFLKPMKTRYPVPQRAETHGRSEEYFGRWFRERKVPRDSVVLATKVFNI